MQKFSQKWCVVSFLEPIEVGAEFDWKDWPLHVTLIGPFSASAKALDELSVLLGDQKPVVLTVDGEDHWGEHGEYHVKKFQKTPEIMQLHKAILAELTEKGGEVNDPQYVGDDFIPHSTVQKGKGLHDGDCVELKEASIIDMFPGGDAHKRAAVKTIKFTYKTK